MRSKSDILKQLYLVLIGLCLIFLLDGEKIHWIGWVFIIEYFRRLLFYFYKHVRRNNK